MDFIKEKQEDFKKGFKVIYFMKYMSPIRKRIYERFLKNIEKCIEKQDNFLLVNIVKLDLISNYKDIKKEDVNLWNDLMKIIGAWRWRINKKDVDDFFRAGVFYGLGINYELWILNNER